MADKIWLKRVLIPLWVVQLIVLAIITVSCALSLYVVNAASDEVDDRLSDNGYSDQTIDTAVKEVKYAQFLRLLSMRH